MGQVRAIFSTPWIWSFVGAFAVWLATIIFTGGYGAGGMITAALSLAVFMVIVGVGQMFVITLGPGNVDRVDDETRRQRCNDRRDAQRPDQQIVGDADGRA